MSRFASATHHSLLIPHYSVLVNQHVRHPILPNPPAIHPLRIERHREVAGAIEDDAAAVAFYWLEFLVDHFVARLLHGHAFVLHERGDVVRAGPADEELAGAGRGDGDGIV